MRRSHRVRVLVTAALLVAAAGAVDAAVGAVWDQFAILALVIALLMVALVATATTRPNVAVRADLVRWLRSRSAIEGEPLETLVDRAIATYRELLRPDRREER